MHPVQLRRIGERQAGRGQGVQHLVHLGVGNVEENRYGVRNLESVMTIAASVRSATSDKHSSRRSSSISRVDESGRLSLRFRVAALEPRITVQYQSRSRTFSLTTLPALGSMYSFTERP